MDRAYVGLFAFGEPWWVAYFNAEPASTEIYCDVATPPQWDDDQEEVTMTDLDLDVVRSAGNRQVLLLDEDEFAEHQVRYGYPREVIRQAERSAAWLQAAVRRPRGAVRAHLPILAGAGHLTAMSPGVYYAHKWWRPAVVNRVPASIEVPEEDRVL